MLQQSPDFTLSTYTLLFVGSVYTFCLVSPCRTITGWAVALTFCISHSAKYRKKADFGPSGSRNPQPILTKPGMVDCVRDPTPHDNFGGGSATWVVWAHTWLGKSLSFFYFFTLLLYSARAQVAFLDRWNDLYAKTHVSDQGLCLLGVSTISDYI